MKADNLILIGMPASGKSTIGVILAKILGYDFIDTDLLIQKTVGKRLPKIIEQEGIDGFIRIENDICKCLQADHSVIATGGSVVYGEEAMRHFQSLGHIIYLQVDYETLAKRLQDIRQRGVVLREGQTLHELYDVRTKLYEQYADVTIFEGDRNIERIVGSISDCINKKTEI